jgi:hypothetical protein
MLLSGVVILAAVAVATPGAAVMTGHAVTGPVAGSAPFEFSDCSFVHQTYRGRLTTPDDVVARLHVDVCVALASGSSCTVDGRFVIKKAAGKVRGTVDGRLACFSLNPIAFDFTLHVRHSPARLATVGQSLHFRGQWISDAMVGGPFDASVTLT